MKWLFKLLSLFIMMTTFSSADAIENFSVVKSTLDIGFYLQQLPKDSIILVDVDDTIITPRSKTFRTAPYNKLIDNIKKNKDNYPTYQEIVSNWRLQRKVMLLDENWPAMLKQLRENFSVYAITKMDTGRFGNIPSMEQWRYEELRDLGIEFSKNNEIPSTILDDGQNNPMFYNGIFITGERSKSQTLDIYRSFLKSSIIVLIDDRLEHLEDIKAFCDKHSIKFIGLLFKGLEKFKDRPDPTISDFQAKYLIKNAKWLEDDKAYKVMNQSKTKK